VQRLIEDAELRENLRAAFEASRRAYDRMNGKGPAKALDDKKVQRELKQAANSLKTAADSLRAKPKRKKRRGGRLIVLALIGGGVAVGLNEGLRKKVLDALFGAEEEFEYTSTTTPETKPGWEPAKA